MHLKHFLQILTFLCLGSYSTEAQVPGYLGKRMSLTADMQATTALYSPTANNRGGAPYGDTGGGLGANWQAGVRFGYALSRTKELIATAGYIKTGMTLDAQTFYENPFSPNAEYDNHYLFYNIAGPTIEFGLRTYNPIKGAIAPFGRSHAWVLQAMFLDGEILDKRTSYAYSVEPRTTHAPLNIKTPKQHWTLGYEFGQNFIIKDVVLLHFGGRLNIPVRIDKILILEEESFEENQVLYDKAIFRRMALHSLMTFKVGAGILF